MNKKALSSLQMSLNTWAVVLAVWSIYRTKVAMPIWFDEFIAKPLVFILPVYFYIYKFEHKPFLSQIWFGSKKILGDLAISLSLGGVLLATAYLAHSTRTGIYDVTTLIGDKNIMFIIAIAIATSISEEIVSRGFILKRLYEDSKNLYSSIFLASILFLILHIPILLSNKELSGTALLMFLATDLVLSLVNSVVFLERKSLVPVILIHALYNLSVVIYS